MESLEKSLSNTSLSDPTTKPSSIASRKNEDVTSQQDTTSEKMPVNPTSLQNRTQTDSTFIVEEEGPVGDDNVSKLTYVFGLLRKFVGVKDLVQLRISLPAHLMEPQSNLEFWNYNDRPDIFVSISTPEDPILRFTNVLRWWFSRDTKWKDNQLRKPFNPILGEQFLCQWEVEPQPAFEPEKSVAVTDTNGKRMTVRCITEQISHHPPVSAFYYACEEAGVIARGIDHVIAKFTGTSFKVGPGEYNHGIYVTLPNRDDEEYNLTHPWATVNGFLMGKPYIVVSESTIIVCPKTNLKGILEYKEEPMFGRARFEIVGKIFRHDYKQESNWTEKERKEKNKLKSVPEQDVVAIITGQWNGKVFISFRLDLPFMTQQEGQTRLSASKKQPAFSEPTLLFDLAESVAVPKIVKPRSEQGPNESGRVWEKVVDALQSKDYCAANVEKRKVEERQREEAKKREISQGTEIPYQPTYFKFHDLKEHHASQGKIGPPVDMELGKPYLKEEIVSRLFESI